MMGNAIGFVKGLGRCNRPDKPVTLLWQGFDIQRAGGIVLQRKTNLADAIVQPLIEFDKRRFAPDR